MEDAAFSDEFCRFLRAAIPSVDAAELLLTLLREPDRWWSALDAAAALRPLTALAEGDAARYFRVFEEAGLLAAGADKRVRYEPGSERLHAHARTLERAYRERPVTLIRAIYAHAAIKRGLRRRGAE
jgi:hypothetical protein